MHSTDQITSVVGLLVQFNLSPKGVPEGMVIRTSGGAVQVNFDPALAGAVTKVVAEGQRVDLAVVPFAEAHADAHAVHELVRLTAPDGAAIVADGPAEVDVSVRGKVVRLNHARRGEVNGGILDTGEFVHLKPHGVRAVGGLRVGQALEARGEVRPGWSGTRVVEAREANGIAIGKPPPKPHAPRPHHHPKPDGAPLRRATH